MLEFLFTKTPLAFLTMPLWRDEAFSYLLAAKPFFQIPFLTSQDFSPPLYYLILNLWMKIFGSSEVAIRSLSLVFFVLTVYIAFDFMLEILKVNKKRIWIYFVFLLASPFLGYYAFEARMYTMLAFFATASWFFLLKHKWRWYVVCVALGLHTHYFMSLVFLSQIAYTFVLPKTALLRKHLVKNSVAVGILSIPWAIFVLINRPPVQSQFWITQPTSKDIFTIPVTLLTGIENSARGNANIIIMSMAVLLWVYCIFMAKRLFKRRPDHDNFLALLFWTIVPIVIVLLGSIVKPLYLPRYIIFTSVGFMLLLFFFLEHTKEKARIVLLIIIGVFLCYYQGYQLRNKAKPDIRSTIREIKTLSGPNDVIYVDNELNFHAAQYYYGPSKVFIISKTHKEIPTFVGKILIPASSIKLSPPQYPARAFIINSNLDYDIQSTQ